MCKDCGAGNGAPVDVTDEMRAARAAVDAIYAEPWGSSGAALHVEIDDSNVEDEFFGPGSRAGVEKTWREWYADEPPSGLELCLAAFDALAPLTVAQRATVVDWPELFA